MLLLRPAIPAVVCLVAGILAAWAIPFSFWIWLALAAIPTALLVVPTGRKTWVAGVAFLFLGATLYSARYQIFHAADLRLLLDSQPRIVSVRGILERTPEERESQFAGKKRTNTLTRLKVREIELDGAWRPATGRLAVNFRGTLPIPSYRQDQVELNGIIAPPTPPTVPLLFDYGRYLYHQRIFFQLTVDEPERWQLLSQPDRLPPLSDRFLLWAKKQFTRAVPEGDTVGLVQSAVLGTRTALTPDATERFMKTGTLHVFAISGLHVACLAGFLIVTFRWLHLPRELGAWLGLPILWLYTIATGWQPSAVRAAIMGSVILLGMGLHRPADLANSLALAAGLILVVQPEQLFQTSFQLSFTVVAAIVIFVPVMEKAHAWALQSFRPDPFLPRRFWSWTQRYVDWIVGHGASLILIGIASWLGSLPLSASYFNLVTPISLIANLAAVPLSSLSLVFGVLTLVTAPIPGFGSLANLFNQNAWWFMEMVVDATDFFAKWGYFQAPRPTAALLAFYYLALAGLLLGWHRFRNLEPGSLARTGRLTWLATCGLLLCITGLQSLNSARTTTLTILPIAGTPIHFDAPGRALDLVLDCSDASAAERTLLRYFRAHGVNILPAVALTHGDIDHVEGFDLLDQEIGASQVFTSSVTFRSPTYKRVTASLAKSPQRWQQVKPGADLRGWKVLHPPAGDRSSRADDKPLVLHHQFGASSILLLSDLSAKGRAALLNTYPELRADIVIAGIPEDGPPINSEFLQRIGAQLCILGTVASTRGFQSDPPWRRDLLASGIPIWLTSERGAVTLEIKNKTLRASSMLNPEQWVPAKINLRPPPPGGI